MNGSLEELPARLALEIDSVCDDFERHWRRASRSGRPRPEIDSFADRITHEARPILWRYLRELESELQRGVALPELPGLILEDEIGRGGMGVVYRGRRSDGRAVAVKLIPGAEHARWSRWLAELADLRHPNLVPLESFGVHEGLYFVVMPLVLGGDLKERLSEFHESSQAAWLTARIADAVAYLHGCGILHRDLKPSNILLSGVEPLVCDFGLAGRLGDFSTGSIVGTPAYMSPEQSEGRPLTPAADVFGLGAVLQSMLRGPTRSEPVDAQLESICRRCLHPDPQERYPTAAELADELRQYLREQP